MSVFHHTPFLELLIPNGCVFLPVRNTNPRRQYAEPSSSQIGSILLIFSFCSVVEGAYCSVVARLMSIRNPEEWCVVYSMDFFFFFFVVIKIDVLFEQAGCLQARWSGCSYLNKALQQLVLCQIFDVSYWKCLKRQNADCDLL